MVAVCHLAFVVWVIGPPTKGFWCSLLVLLRYPKLTPKPTFFGKTVGRRNLGFLANVNSRSRSLYAVARTSVCRLSVTLVRPTQAVQIFGYIYTAFGTLAIR